MSGTFVSVTGPSARSVAQRIGSTEFLLPDGVTDPARGMPPLTTRSAMEKEKAPARSGRLGMRSLASALARFNYLDCAAALLALRAGLAAAVAALAAAVAPTAVAALAVAAAMLVLADRPVAVPLLWPTAPVALGRASVAATAAVSAAMAVAVAKRLAGAVFARRGDLGGLGAAEQALQPGEKSLGCRFRRRLGTAVAGALLVAVTLLLAATLFMAGSLLVAGTACSWRGPCSWRGRWSNGRGPPSRRGSRPPLRSPGRSGRNEGRCSYWGLSGRSPGAPSSWDGAAVEASHFTAGRADSAGGRIWISGFGAGCSGWASAAATGAGVTVGSSATGAGASILAGSGAGGFAGSGLANGFLYSRSWVITSMVVGL